MPPQQTTTPAYMQSRVRYMAGHGSFGGGLALLEWSGDNHIRLFTLDPATQQSTGVVFDCVTTQITKVKGNLAMLTFYIGNAKYMVDLSASALPWLMMLGVIGIIMSRRKRQQSGVQWWLDNLKRQGVNVRQSVTDGPNFLLYVVLGIIGFFMLIFLAAFLVNL